MNYLSKTKMRAVPSRMREFESAYLPAPTLLLRATENFSLSSRSRSGSSSRGNSADKNTISQRYFNEARHLIASSSRTMTPTARRSETKSMSPELSKMRSSSNTYTDSVSAQGKFLRTGFVPLRKKESPQVKQSNIFRASRKEPDSSFDRKDFKKISNSQITTNSRETSFCLVELKPHIPTKPPVMQTLSRMEHSKRPNPYKSPQIVPPPILKKKNGCTASFHSYERNFVKKKSVMFSPEERKGI